MENASVPKVKTTRDARSKSFSAASELMAISQPSYR